MENILKVFLMAFPEWLACIFMVVGLVVTALAAVRLGYGLVVAKTVYKWIVNAEEKFGSGAGAEKKAHVIAACLAVMLLGGGGLFYQRANAVASVVSLDVNPSIELKVNRSEKVLVCTPLNEDAKAILADMGSGADLKGAKLDVAVNAIVGSLVRNGYLDSISSAIMISVEDEDAEIGRAHV